MKSQSKISKPIEEPIESQSQPAKTISLTMFNLIDGDWKHMSIIFWMIIQQPVIMPFGMGTLTSHHGKWQITPTKNPQYTTTLLVKYHANIPMFDGSLSIYIA